MVIITTVKSSKGIVTENRKTGERGYIPMPMTTVGIRLDTWADDDTIMVLKHPKGYTATFRNGDKVKHTPTSLKVWAAERFGWDAYDRLMSAMG